MSIEELVNRAYTTWAHEKGTSWTGHMHAALTEQSETHAIELRAYETTVENLEQRIRELEHELQNKQFEAQMVPDVRCKCCGYLVTESEHKGCLRAADATAPEGWQLVPIEPTDEMIDAGCDEADAYRVDIDRAYRAMLSVAPEVGDHD